MARPKGGKNKRWSTEEKLRIVRRYFDERIGQRTLAKEENISAGQLYNWIKRYAEGGPEAMKNRKKPAILLRQFIRVRLSLKNNG